MPLEKNNSPEAKINFDDRLTQEEKRNLNIILDDDIMTDDDLQKFDSEYGISQFFDDLVNQSGKNPEQLRKNIDDTKLEQEFTALLQCYLLAHYNLTEFGEAERKLMINGKFDQATKDALVKHCLVKSMIDNVGIRIGDLKTYSAIDEEDFDRNPVVEELKAKYPHFPELLAYLEKNNVTITLGKQNIKIQPTPQYFQWMIGILETQQALKKPSEKNILPSFEKSITDWKKNITEFIAQKDDFHTIYFIGASADEDHNGVFKSFNGDYKTLIKNTYTAQGALFKDYSHNVKPTTTSDYVLNSLEKNLEKNKEGKILFILGLHGDESGNAMYGGDEGFSHDDFQRLHDLAERYPSLVLDIDSCHSGSKFLDSENSLKGNIMLSSSDQSSTAKITTKFLEAYQKEIKDGKEILKGDFDGDGRVSYNEAVVYRMLNTKTSITPTAIKTKDGKVMRIAESGEKSTSEMRG